MNSRMRILRSKYGQDALLLEVVVAEAVLGNAVGNSVSTVGSRQLLLGVGEGAGVTTASDHQG
jgi:hypothetical protein